MADGPHPTRLSSRFPDHPQARALAESIFKGAAPGEVEGLDLDQSAAIVALSARALATREAGRPAILLEGEEASRGRRMALVIVNDDMPFLVDSVTAAVTAAGLAIERLLHPVLDVARDEGGCLVELHGLSGGEAAAPGHLRESLIYLEIERADEAAGARLTGELYRALADTRAAVEDWGAMLAELRQTARALTENAPPLAPHELAEDVAFLEWIAADNFTFLGARRYELDAEGLSFTPAAPGLGLLRDPELKLWPGTGCDLPEPLDAFVRRPDPLLIAKSNLVSTVHRRAYCDYLSVKRYDASGRTVGETRFLGLFTSSALNASPRSVPLIRRKVGQVIAKLGYDPRGHSGKALIHVLESFPRDELFQVEPERLTEMALGLLSLLDRPRPRLFVRSDAFRQHITALVYVPRDSYTSHVRQLVTRMLETAFGADLDRYEVELRSEGLARIHFQFGLGGAAPPEIDEAALNRRLVTLVRGWDETLEADLARRVGSARAARLARSYGRAFSPSYRAQFTAEEAAEDIVRLDELGAGEHDVHLYRRAEDPPGQLRMKIYHLDHVIPLSDAVPVLERFGFRVIEEYPFDVDADRRGWIHDFVVEISGGNFCDVHKLNERVAPALRCVLGGEQENDVFNALVVEADLTAEAAGWIRAYFRYLRQTGGAAYGQATVVDAMRRQPAIARDLVALFEGRFDPKLSEAERLDACERAQARITEAMTGVESIDDDRLLRFYLDAILATVRTNAFAPAGHEALAFKIDSCKVPGLPPPVPFREIFVYSPRVEGIHLRGGPVARGGIRWSDRRDDFRTEIMGLLKAQIVKNAVIVPTGAKGGFYPKLLPPPSERELWLSEGTECYRIFIRALLSVTDNLEGGEVVPPEGVVRYDGDDPYFVVAADKGTATFSDIANAISVKRGFWLGDAFASGGRNGYDHKAMGITARGAWISVQRHFAEMGVDVQTDPIRIVGVGDMSGDVFGNGLLMSKSVRLIAAFDHRHIFIDPDPDPAASYAERERLFKLPRSSWADYDPAKLSEGGGVYPRSQKLIELSEQACRALGTDKRRLTPSELICAVLKAPADLAWFGGIGTYVKAEGESHVEVGDRSNDMNRVDASELRVKVIGEGANLAITQAGRIEFAKRGGRINTDFIDNSAGVDCSDHEVNIKIALQPEVAAGRLPLAERNALLEAMTEEVAQLVLHDNRMQTLALSLAERRGASAVPAFTRVIQTLEAGGRLDRSVEGLPSDDFLSQRAQAGFGMARPELAVLLAHAKLALYEDLVGSALPDDPMLRDDLLEGFPPVLAGRFTGALESHRLRREIIATTLANEIVNRGGITLAFELAEQLSSTLAHVGSAFVAVRELFDFGALWRLIDAVPNPALQIMLHTQVIEGLRIQMSDAQRAYGSKVLPSEIVRASRPGVRRLEEQLETILRAEPRAQLNRYAEELAERGAPPEIAAQLVRIQALDGAIGVAHLAQELDAPEVRIAQAYTAIGQALGLDWAKGKAVQLAPADPWERLLVASLEREFEQLRFELIRRTAKDGRDPLESATAWLAANDDRVSRIASTVGRARTGAATTSAMLAHIATQARTVLAA